MSITPAMVRDLHEKTGAGMMDAKKALEENGGNMEQAIDWLRQKGMAKAAKKSGRAAAEGMVVALSNGEFGVMIEVNAETDFASRNESFAGFAKKAAELALAAKTGDVEAIQALPYGNGKTVAEELTNLIATVGENMQLRRAACLEAQGGTVGAYVHMGGKIGVLTAISGQVGDVARHIAMHVAASNPASLNRESIDQELLARETAVYTAQATESGKPAEVAAKIVQGRVNKFLEEVCLVEQPFVMDPDRKVMAVVDGACKGAVVTGFVRFGLGEGVEKAEDNFAEEVMKMASGQA